MQARPLSTNMTLHRELPWLVSELLTLRHLKRQLLNLGIVPIDFRNALADLLCITFNALKQLLNYAACRTVEFG